MVADYCGPKSKLSMRLQDKTIYKNKLLAVRTKNEETTKSGQI